MPMRIANTYDPASPLGFGLRAATRALFMHDTPNEMREQDRADMLARSTVALQRSQADVYDLKRKLSEQQYRARSPEGVASYVRAQAPEADPAYLQGVLSYLTTGQWPEGMQPGLEPVPAMPLAPSPTPGSPPPLTGGTPAAPPSLYQEPAVAAAPPPVLPMGEMLGGMPEIPQGTNVPRGTWDWSNEGREPAPFAAPPWREEIPQASMGYGQEFMPAAQAADALVPSLDAILQTMMPRTTQLTGRTVDERSMYARPPAGMSTGMFFDSPASIGRPGPPDFGSPGEPPTPFPEHPAGVREFPPVDVEAVRTAEAVGPAAIVPQAQALVRSMNPGQLEMLRRIAAAYATMQSVNMGDENVNPRDIAQAYQENVAAGPQADILYGRTTPEVGGARMSAVAGKDLYGQAPYGTYNQFTGQMGTEYAAGRELDVQKAETERRKQRYYDRMPRPSGAGARTKDPTKMTGVQARRVDNALSAILYGEMERAGIAGQEEQAATSIDPRALNAIKSRAHELLTDPNGEFWDDAEGAVEQALMEIAPDGWEDAGEQDPGIFGWRNWLGVEQPRLSHALRPKGGGTARSPGAAASPAADPLGIR